ncbi:MAG: hypothetical protein HON90_04765 [Halobacteriovoraceae bacterium]|nr:hypothetical protein [Halobacteriovoraceae bacterium]
MKKMIGLVLMCFTLVSCNGSSGSDDDTGLIRKPEGCRQGFLASACLPAADWLVKINKANFPQNVSFKVDRQELFNECSGDTSPFVLTRGVPVLLEAERFIYLSGKFIKIELIDLGSNCLGKEVFYSAEEQRFEMSGSGVDRLVEIIID